MKQNQKHNHRPPLKIMIILNGFFGKTPVLSGGEMRVIKLMQQWNTLVDLHLLSSESAKKLLNIFKLSAFLHVFPSWSTNETKFAFLIRAMQTLFTLPHSLKTFSIGVVYSGNDSLFDVIPGVKLKLMHPHLKWIAVVHWLPPFPPWKRRQSTVINSCLFYLNQRLSLLCIKLFADGIFAVSPTTAHDLLKTGISKNKIYTVSCGIDTIQTKKTKKLYNAIFMKRLQSVKGIYDLLPVWQLVLKKNPSAKLLIVGKMTPEGQKLKQLVQNAHLTKNILFLDFVYDQKQKSQLFSQSQLLILPSYEENWAIVIGEAMAMGVPCVAYALPELKAVWKNQLLYAPIGNIEALSKQIVNLLFNQSLREEKELMNHQFIKRYLWKNIAKEELQHIQAISRL